MEHVYKANKDELTVDIIKDEEKPSFKVDPDWSSRINNPEDVELVEVKLLLPKILVDRFKDARTFLGDKASTSYAYTISTRISKYLLRYHKLCTRKECSLLNMFLNINNVKAAFKAFDAGEIGASEAANMIKGGTK